MGRPTLKVGNYRPEDIKAMFRDDERYTIGLRLYAVYQVSLGQSSRKLEALYNTSFKQITNWVHRFEAEGIDGLRDKAGRGRTSRLNEAQQERIKVVLGDSPQHYGYNSATWTGPMLIEWINKEFNILYKKAQIYNIIKRLGFSYQRGRGVFPEADEQKQEVFKETLKKNFLKTLMRYYSSRMNALYQTLQPLVINGHTRGSNHRYCASKESGNGKHYLAVTIMKADRLLRVLQIKAIIKRSKST